MFLKGDKVQIINEYRNASSLGEIVKQNVQGHYEVKCDSGVTKYVHETYLILADKINSLPTNQESTQFTKGDRVKLLLDGVYKIPTGSLGIVTYVTPYGSVEVKFDIDDEVLALAPESLKLMTSASSNQESLAEFDLSVAGNGLQSLLDFTMQLQDLGENKFTVSWTLTAKKVK